MLKIFVPVAIRRHRLRLGWWGEPVHLSCRIAMQFFQLQAEDRGSFGMDGDDSLRGLAGKSGSLFGDSGPGGSGLGPGSVQR